jgi:hypothetical protein
MNRTTNYTHINRKLSPFLSPPFNKNGIDVCAVYWSSLELDIGARNGVLALDDILLL